jgi:hypothetical protein
VRIIDLPGAASPYPGMPLNNDEALVDYIRRQGYRYVAFVRPSEAQRLYRRDQWEALANDPGGLAIWKMSAPFYLRMFDRIDSMALTRPSLYDDGKMIAFDLAAPVSPFPAPRPSQGKARSDETEDEDDDEEAEPGEPPKAPAAPARRRK